MSSHADYYDVLGVERGSDAKSIKRAYRSAAKRLHPDLPANKGNRDSARQFRKISEAYEVLVDPDRRRRYDLTGRDGGVTWTSAVDGPSSRQSEPDFQFKTRTGEGMASVFADLFAVDPSVASEGTGKRDSPWRPGELGRKLPEDSPPGSAGAASASSGRFRFGFDPEELAEKALSEDLEHADDALSSPQAPRIERVDPRGTMERLVDEDAFLRREGRDVVLDLPLSPAEAAGGCELAVPTVDGRVRVRIPPGVRAGQRIRLRDRGLPRAGGLGRGHQVLVVRIELPPHLEPAHIELLRSLDEQTGFRPRAGLWEREEVVEVEEVSDDD